MTEFPLIGTARSSDGRLVRIDAPQAVELGAFLSIRTSTSTLIVCVESVRVADDDSCTAFALAAGRLNAEGAAERGADEPFADAEVRRTSPEEHAELNRASGARMPVGSTRGRSSLPVGLIPKRFNRHTFWCGQSGSGKTYALGVVLEQLLLHAELPIVILDPNADFVGLGTPRPGAPEREAREIAERDIRVLRPAHLGGEPLRARLRSMTMEAKAALFRLDPIVDRDEYHVFHHLGEVATSGEAGALVADLIASGEPARVALGRRIENIGVLRWEVWSGDATAVTETIAERPDATVLDIGSFTTPDESLVIALAVLDDLWARREERRPVLIVIDEAHNLCSPDLDTPLAVAVRNRIVQIAAEGRKFGLWLLLSTQRPSKVHPGIVSQCDNLTLMKMASPHDLAELSSIFGFAPTEMVAASPRFRQGEALMAGGFVVAPTLIQMGERRTVEGGVDVPIPLRDGPVVPHV